MFKPLSPLEKLLLTYFFSHTEARQHLHEIARKLKVDPSNLDKKLKELLKMGVFKVEKQGNQRIYSLNAAFPLFQEYKAIIEKTYGVEAKLKYALQKIKGLDLAIVFGSYASGNLDQFSDIDLLAVGHHNSLNLSKTLTMLEKSLNREINVVELAPEDFEKRRKNDPFLLNIFAHKTIQLIP